MTKLLTYVELDIDYCSLSYGESPCTAAIGITGSNKCYNSLNTCQDRPNFTSSTVTLRFTKDVGFLPTDIEAIPSLIGVDFTSGKVSLGEDLGQRASVVIKFKDHRHGDAGQGFDKYVGERSYNPFEQGTLWGKFRARQPFIKGNNIRVIRGTVGQAIGDMDTRHYIVESFNGPTVDGVYTLVAKDILKLADSDRAKAPVLAQGSIVAAIDDVATSATLTPSGIGDALYSSSGYANIGGKEVAAFTRSADVVTLTRGEFNTEAVSHEAGERFQECVYYQSEDPADIIYDLLVNYAGISSTYISLSNWQIETSTYYNRLMTALITEPISVNQLVSEIIQQVPLAMWWDDENQTIRLQVIREVSSSAQTFDRNNILAGSFSSVEQPNKRVSQAWTYYTRRNPVQPIDELDNYKSALATIDSESESNYGQSAVKTILSRWIPDFASSTAQRLNNLILGRYADPPRMFKFDVFKHGDDDLTVELGQGYLLSNWNIQDASGAEVTTPVQVIRLNQTEDRYQVEAEEILITETETSEDLTNRTITIDSNTTNVNFRTLHDNIYPDPEENESPTVHVTCVIAEGVIVSSTSTSGIAFDVGTWPDGVVLTVRVLGRIQGAGGNGGRYETSYSGSDGGIALYTREYINLDMNGSDGEIWGGAGGGAAIRIDDVIAAGGGGAGIIAGLGGTGNGPGTPDGGDGTATAGGEGGTITFFGKLGGDGGDPGEDGISTSGGDSSGTGGTAGDAIDGVSYVTFTNGSGDILGDQTN